MSDIKKTIKRIRKINHSTNLRNWYDTKIISAIDLHKLADAYEAKEAEVAELRKQVAAINKGVQRYAGVNNRLSAENAELREVLGHYASRATWSCGHCSRTKPKHECTLDTYFYHTDGFAHAQAVLNKYKESGV